MKYSFLAKFFFSVSMLAIGVFLLTIYDHGFPFIYTLAIIISAIILSFFASLIAQMLDGFKIAKISKPILVGLLLILTPFLINTAINKAGNELTLYEYRQLAKQIEDYKTLNGELPLVLEDLKTDIDLEKVSYHLYPDSGHYELSVSLGYFDVYAFDSKNKKWEIENWD